jgi:hypothetical protein
VETNQRTGLRARTAAAGAACALAAACAWSVPADPGVNSARRGGPPRAAAPTPEDGAPALRAAAPDDGARTTYLTRCGRCHEPFPPSHATASEWPRLVRKYGPRAGLFGAERERVLRWLRARAPGAGSA